MNKILRPRIIADSCPAIISKSLNIYENLAFENWLYNNIEFTSRPCNHEAAQESCDTDRKPLMFIWRNGKAIVYGRHQNPWLEARTEPARRHGIQLARRYSGGGCVYHDQNNLNISIISRREHFSHRQDNLKFVADYLSRTFGIQSEPTPRHDLILTKTGEKISGSAARLGRYNYYHHFTLLVNVHMQTLHSVLRQSVPDYIETSSSKSVRASVQNLKSLCPTLNITALCVGLATAFREHQGYSPESAIQSFTFEQMRALPDYDDTHKQLTSWDWIYGKTPKFKLRRQFESIIITIDVNKGHIEALTCEPYNKMIQSLAPNLVGTKFEFSAIDAKIETFMRENLPSQKSRQKRSEVDAAQAHPLMIIKLMVSDLFA